MKDYNGKKKGKIGKYQGKVVRMKGIAIKKQKQMSKLKMMNHPDLSPIPVSRCNGKYSVHYKYLSYPSIANATRLIIMTYYAVIRGHYPGIVIVLGSFQHREHFCSSSSDHW